MRIASVLAIATGMLSGCANQPLPAACYTPPDSGQCRAALPRYWYDVDTHSCKQFIWGGCGGTVPFETLQACEQSCAAPADSEALPETRPRRGGY